MKTILILDDETAVRESFTDYFEDQLWNVMQAGSGEEALQLLEQESVQAAVVDVRLPGIDGNEFIREICKKTDKIAFVICTGSPEYVVPNDLLAIPCVASKLMKKPVNSFGDLEELIFQTMDGLKDNVIDDH